MVIHCIFPGFTIVISVKRGVVDLHEFVASPTSGWAIGAHGEYESSCEEDEDDDHKAGVFTHVFDHDLWRFVN